MSALWVYVVARTMVTPNEDSHDAAQEAIAQIEAAGLEVVDATIREKVKG